MKRKLLRYFLILIVSIYILITIFPVFVVFVMGSWKNDDLMRTVPYWFGNYFIQNLKNVLASNYLKSYANSIFVSAAAVCSSAFASTLLGYAISKYDFKGRKLLNRFVIATMMLPQQITIIGYVMEMRFLHMNNTLLPIIVCWIANPFAAFFMIQFMKESVPDEVLESARIDGAGEVRVLSKIVLPFIKPGLATVGILIFLWSWNNYMLPLVTISKDSLMTIPLFVNNLGSEYRDDIGARMCAISLAIIPILVVFSIFSKSFIKGISAGAVKG